MGLKVITDGRNPVTVYRQERDVQNGQKRIQYALGVSSKDREGNWVNGYIDCQFKKGVDVPNKSKIEISNSFYTVNKYNGKKYYKIFILEFQIVGGEVPQQAPLNFDDGFMNIPDDIDEELPFN